MRRLRKTVSSSCRRSWSDATRLNFRSNPGMPDLTDLTALTLAEARDALKSRRRFQRRIDAGASRRDRARRRAQRLCRRHRRSGAGDGGRERRAHRQGRGGAARGSAARRQGPLRHQGRSYAGLQPHPRWFQAALRVDRHRPSLARRRGDARQAEHGRVRDGLVERDLLLRPRRLALVAAELERRQGARRARRRQARPADAGRILGRFGRGGRRASVPRRDRERHRRLDPSARRLHRHDRHQADLWPLLALGHGRLRVLARSGGAARAHGARRRDHVAFDGGAGREGFRPASIRRCPITRRRSGVR